MGLFGRKKKEIDEFPLLTDDLPPLPALPKERQELPERRMEPEFPEHKPFIPAPMKDRLSEINMDKRMPSLPMQQRKLPLPNIDNQERAIAKPMNISTPKQNEITNIPAEKNVSFKGIVEEKRANVFVKLEKYNEILNNLETLDDRVKELEKIISRVQDYRSKEKDIMMKWNEILISTKDEIARITKSLPSA